MTRRFAGWRGARRVIGGGWLRPPPQPPTGRGDTPVPRSRRLCRSEAGSQVVLPGIVAHLKPMQGFVSDGKQQSRIVIAHVAPGTVIQLGLIYPRDRTVQFRPSGSQCARGCPRATTIWSSRSKSARRSRWRSPLCASSISPGQPSGPPRCAASLPFLRHRELRRVRLGFLHPMQQDVCFGFGKSKFLSHLPDFQIVQVHMKWSGLGSRNRFAVLCLAAERLKHLRATRVRKGQSDRTGPLGRVRIRPASARTPGRHPTPLVAAAPVT